MKIYSLLLCMYNTYLKTYRNQQILTSLFQFECPAGLGIEPTGLEPPA